MKLRVDVDGEALLLELRREEGRLSYTLQDESGHASVEEVMPGVFSVLITDRSFQVHVSPHPQGLEVWTGLRKHVILLSNPRDRTSGLQRAGADGPVELRAQMPGKIIKLLASEGSPVAAGEGLIVVEAMKMQNEVKTPKAGTLTRVHVREGATVSAGDLLVTVE